MRRILFAASLAALPLPASADVIHVYPDGSGDAATIAEAYAIAERIVDQIEVHPGTYYEHDIVMTEVTLYSSSDNPHDTIIDAQGLGRCLSTIDMNWRGPTFRGIMLQNGTHPVEGGLVMAGPGDHPVNYENCVFRNGAAPRGGAVSVRARPAAWAPDFTDCVFEDCAADLDGGAIWTWTYTEATNCTFRDHSAGRHGGAIYSEKTHANFNGVELTDCLLENNVALGDGGAVFSVGPGYYDGAYITFCHFVGNQAANGGAARLNEYDVVLGSTFIENSAAQNGGALTLESILINWYTGDESYAANVFVRNQAGSRGGALSIFGAAPDPYWGPWGVVSCTFVGNGAPEGGHYWASVEPDAVELDRCIFAFATDGGAAAGPTSTASSCLDVYGNVGGDYVGPLAEGISEPTNISADPLFCNPAADDYTLSEDSPCAAKHSGGCGQIGRYDVGCSPVSVQPESWAGIKARYR